MLGAVYLLLYPVPLFDVGIGVTRCAKEKTYACMRARRMSSMPRGGGSFANPCRVDAPYLVLNEKGHKARLQGKEHRAAAQLLPYVLNGLMRDGVVNTELVTLFARHAFILLVFIEYSTSIPGSCLYRP